VSTTSNHKPGVRSASSVEQPSPAAALLPAWRFTGTNGLEVVVDASTGRILR
jgi:hypothetical protein